MVILFIYTTIGVDPTGHPTHAWFYAGKYADAGYATAAAKELGLTEHWYKLVNTGVSA